MAKALPLFAVNIDGKLAENAPLMLHIRLEELYHFAPFISDPGNVEELHNMRIAAKRLRYTLEVFAVCFESKAYNEIYNPAKEIQERIGEIHDCDVRVPLLERFLEKHAASRPEVRIGLEKLAESERLRRNGLYNDFVEFWTALNKANYRRRFLSFLASAD
jgi:CHAD domain-containing protein